MLLDIGLGILAAILITHFASLNFNLWIVAAGIIFTLLPDLDFIIYFIKRGKSDEFSHTHRNLFHNPFLFIPIGFLIFIFININLAYLFVICALIHFLHDSIGLGWGIRWWYPFSKKYYKFFSDQQGKITSNFLISWTPEEQNQAASQFGNPHWFADYLNFSREFLIELFIFLIAIIFLIFRILL